METTWPSPVLRRTTAGFEILGQPEGIEHRDTRNERGCALEQLAP